MYYRNVGKYYEEILDEVLQHQLKPFAEHLLENLNHLLGIVNEKHPTIVTKYAETLVAQYDRLWTGKYLSLDNEDVTPLVEELTHLSEFPHLARYFLNYHFQLLNLPKETKWETEKVEITQRTYLRSALFLRYTNLQALTSVIDRSKAIELYKHHISEFQALDPLVMHEDCTHVALKELFDRELKYIVCHGESANKGIFNKGFKLAIEHTTMRGNSYCIGGCESKNQ